MLEKIYSFVLIQSEKDYALFPVAVLWSDLQPFHDEKNNIMAIQTKKTDQTLKTLPNKVFKVELWL